MVTTNRVSLRDRWIGPALATLKVAATAGVLLLVMLATGIIQVTSMKGPMGFSDGRTHYVTEVTFADLIGYSFGGSSPDYSGGWFRPIDPPFSH